MALTVGRDRPCACLLPYKALRGIAGKFFQKDRGWWGALDELVTGTCSALDARSLVWGPAEAISPGSGELGAACSLAADFCETSRNYQTPSGPCFQKI